MTEALFGPLVDGGMVERSVRDTLKTWLHTYLLEAERRNGRGENSIQRPAAWRIASEYDTDASDHLPVVVIVSPGLGDRPEKEGDGSYHAPWDVAVGVGFAAGPNSREVAELYAAALRALMVQQGALRDTELDGHSAGIKWLGESYGEVDEEARTQLFAVRMVFAVEVDNIVNANLGPSVPEPDTDHLSPYTALEVTVDTELGSVTADSGEA